jgi:hypothetical protein
VSGGIIGWASHAYDIAASASKCSPENAYPIPTLAITCRSCLGADSGLGLFTAMSKPPTRDAPHYTEMVYSAIRNQKSRPAKRDGAAANRFFRRLLRSHGGEPRKIVTDKLRSSPVTHREVMSDVVHVTDHYANNRAEQSHEATRLRERRMRRFKSMA